AAARYGPDGAWPARDRALPACSRPLVPRPDRPRYPLPAAHARVVRHLAEARAHGHGGDPHAAARLRARPEPLGAAGALPAAGDARAALLPAFRREARVDRRDEPLQPQ